MKKYDKLKFVHRIWLKLQENKGESLVMVLVAIGIAGILASILAIMQENNQRMFKKATLDNELLEIRRIFSSKIQCVGSSCTDMIAIVNQYRIGNWHFQASCQGDDLYVQTCKFLNDQTTPIQDPIHRIPMPWTNLFTAAGNGYYCSLASVDTQSQIDTDSSNPSSLFPQQQTPQSPQQATPGSNDAQLMQNMQNLIKDFCPQGQTAHIDGQTLNVTCQ